MSPFQVLDGIEGPFVTKYFSLVVHAFSQHASAFQISVIELTLENIWPNHFQTVQLAIVVTGKIFYP